MAPSAAGAGPSAGHAGGRRHDDLAGGPGLRGHAGGAGGRRGPVRGRARGARAVTRGSVVLTGPAVRVDRSWTVRFALIWLGLWAAQLAPVQLLLPLQLEDVDPVHKVRDFGV